MALEPFVAVAYQHMRDIMIREKINGIQSMNNVLGYETKETLTELIEAFRFSNRAALKSFVLEPRMNNGWKVSLAFWAGSIYEICFFNTDTYENLFQWLYIGYLNVIRGHEMSPSILEEFIEKGIIDENMTVKELITFFRYGLDRMTMVSILRKETGCGIMEAKVALRANDWNLEAAERWLKQ